MVVFLKEFYKIRSLFMVWIRRLDIFVSVFEFSSQNVAFSTFSGLPYYGFYCFCFLSYCWFFAANFFSNVIVFTIIIIFIAVVDIFGICALVVVSGDTGGGGGSRGIFFFLVLVIFASSEKWFYEKG